MQTGQTRETASADRSASPQADRRRRATWLARAYRRLMAVAVAEQPAAGRFPSRHGFMVL